VSSVRVDSPRSLLVFLNGVLGGCVREGIARPGSEENPRGKAGALEVEHASRKIPLTQKDQERNPGVKMEVRAFQKELDSEGLIGGG